MVFFEAYDLVKAIDLEFDVNVVKMFWKHDEGSLEGDLKQFRDDGDAFELSMYVVGNDCEVDVFSEPKPVTGEAPFMDRVIENGKGKTCDEEDEKLS